MSYAERPVAYCLGMYFLGIDAGGSKTAIALGDEYRALARFQTGSVKLGRVNEREARENLLSGLRSVCEAAHQIPDSICCCCIGFSGASRADLVAFLLRIAKDAMPSARVEIVGDHIAAHRAAFPDGVGILTVAGTGSICYGRNAKGEEARAGGYGPVVSDEGSGSWIGREAVRRALSATDEGADAYLLNEILKHWELKDIQGLIGHANEVAPAEFASLFPVVLRAAEADLAARTLLDDAARQLADLTVVVARRLSVERIAITGGVADASERLREAFAVDVQHGLPRAQFMSGKIEAAEGALSLAREIHKKD